MSLCDRCVNPGQCCSGFWLNLGEPETYLEALVLMATTGNASLPGYEGNYGDSIRLPSSGDYENIWVGLPFLPLYKTPGGPWKYWCPHLGRDGRCTIYEDRPPLCRAYEPGCDAMCAMHEEDHVFKELEEEIAEALAKEQPVS